MRLIARPSPNFGDRRAGAAPDLIVLHYTAMETAEAALLRLSDPATEVSAHYLISAQGEVYQLVDEDKRAWHAGAGRWGDVCDVNSRSIGIELANTGVQPFSDPQMAALEALLGDIMRRRAIAPERVIGHADMAPGRKIDPGSRFDWRRLAHQGLSIWPKEDEDRAAALASAADPARFRDFAAAFGYATDQGDAAILDVFRARFRPGAEGPLEARDLVCLRALANRFPVDRAAANT